MYSLIRARAASGTGGPDSVKPRCGGDHETMRGSGAHCMPSRDGLIFASGPSMFFCRSRKLIGLINQSHGARPATNSPNDFARAIRRCRSLPRYSNSRSCSASIVTPLSQGADWGTRIGARAQKGRARPSAPAGASDFSAGRPSASLPPRVFEASGIHHRSLVKGPDLTSPRLRMEPCPSAIPQRVALLQSSPPFHRRP
jgi:hypothetical protein